MFKIERTKPEEYIIWTYENSLWVISENVSFDSSYQAEQYFEKNYTKGTSMLVKVLGYKHE